jgi:hypothetical protein
MDRLAAVGIPTKEMQQGLRGGARGETAILRQNQNLRPLTVEVGILNSGRWICPMAGGGPKRFTHAPE